MSIDIVAAKTAHNSKEFRAAAQIIADHRNHLLRRLTTRSPLLKFLPSARRLDITDIFSTIQANVPAPIDSLISKYNYVSTPEQLLTSLIEPNSSAAASIRFPDSKIVAKCTAIRVHAQDYFHTTGQNALYMGYPLLFIPLEAGKYYIAPIFLWPIQIPLPSPNRLIIQRLIEDDVIPPEVNPLLVTWAAQERNIHLSNIDISFIDSKGIKHAVTQVLHQWPGINLTWRADQPMRLYNKEKLKDLARQQTQPIVLSSAIIGLAPFKGKALLKDLEDIQREIEKGSSQLGVLGNYIFPNSGKTFAPSERPTETMQWIVTQADHSQEDAIWQTRESDISILHGPPGTGKSQTIVNIIADALAHKKKVMVVCQKEAALEVVLKRLESVGLGDLVRKIDDLHAQRSSIIKSIRSIDENIRKHDVNEENRAYASEQIMQAERKIDSYVAMLNETQAGQRLSYATLQALLHNEEYNRATRHPNHLEFISCMDGIPASIDELHSAQEELENFLQDFHESRYPENPWRLHINDEAPSRSSQIDLQHWAARVLQYSSELGHEPFFPPYPRHMSWLTEHEWTQHWHLSLLSEERKKVTIPFTGLMKTLRDLSKWFPADAVGAIIREFHASKCPYVLATSYTNNLGMLQTVASVKKKLEKNELFLRLNKYFPDEVTLWKLHFTAAVYRKWLEQYLKVNNLYPPVRIKRAISQLRDQVQKKRSADQVSVKEKFCNRVTYCNRLSNLGLLRLKAAGGIPHTSLRQLYNKGFDALHNLHPVLLTNPDAVSSLLELKPGLYDLLILDEASQVFVADAIPALYRCKSVVVSGDQMQMPPSDFFSFGDGNANQTNDDDDNEDEEEPDDTPMADQNRLIPAQGEYCLLDATIYAVQRGAANNSLLQVHYRSESRELIDFSNHAFYESKLLIPPGNPILPPFLKRPIRFCAIDGNFMRNGINAEESLEVLRILRDEIWAMENPPSVGIVTFNIKQRDAIEDLLTEEALRNEQFNSILERERNRSENGEDMGLFVRSVEHVQGDERDIIIFSTTYDGKRARNFGPVSTKEKGRRRLNVAITRAKKGNIIVSSLDVDRISSEEECDSHERYWLWNYLRYARAISADNTEEARSILQNVSLKDDLMQNKRSAESPFELDVANFLVAKGYHINCQVGESGFRIDLGLKRHEADKRYLCGIECDGKTYHRRWKARMNDIWRQDILESKGWKIIRVWSSDWYDNPQDTQKSLLQRISSCNNA